MRVIRRVRHFLAGNRTYSYDDVFTAHTRAFQTIKLLVRIYYIITLFFISGFLISWLEYSASQPSELLWPVWWTQWLPVATSVYLIWSFALVTVLLTAFFCELRWLRLLSLIGLIELLAFTMSFGKISHEYHGWIWTGAWFILLPNGSWDNPPYRRAFRHNFLLVFWAAQATILGFYSLSGMWKLYGVKYQILAGQISFLHPYGLSYILATDMVITHNPSLLGPLVIKYPLLGWPGSFVTVYIETCAFLAAFRPELHRIWGVLLILLHIGIFIFMSIIFLPAILLLGLILVQSPFTPVQMKWRMVIFQLPIIGAVLAGFSKLLPKNEKAALS